MCCLITGEYAYVGRILFSYIFIFNVDTTFAISKLSFSFSYPTVRGEGG